MFGLENIPTVTKNILLLNILLFVLTFVFGENGIDLGEILGAHYVNSPLFMPYQIVSHFFMHDGIRHIFFNMFALVAFGSFLERLWGPKRYFILYISAAIGAFALYNAMGAYQLMELRSYLAGQLDMDIIDGIIRTTGSHGNIAQNLDNYFASIAFDRPFDQNALVDYIIKARTPMVGASGAIFGIMAAFAILFPNTELNLMFIPIPIKAKYLIGAYFIYEVYNSIYQSTGDHVAHLAHVGGAVVGAALVLIWRKRDKTNFY